MAPVRKDETVIKSNNGKSYNDEIVILDCENRIFLYFYSRNILNLVV